MCHATDACVLSVSLPSLGGARDACSSSLLRAARKSALWAPWSSSATREAELASLASALSTFLPALASHCATGVRKEDYLVLAARAALGADEQDLDDTLKRSCPASAVAELTQHLARVRTASDAFVSLGKVLPHRLASWVLESPACMQPAAPAVHRVGPVAHTIEATRRVASALTVLVASRTLRPMSVLLVRERDAVAPSAGVDVDSTVASLEWWARSAVANGLHGSSLHIVHAPGSSVAPVPTDCVVSAPSCYVTAKSVREW